MTIASTCCLTMEFVTPLPNERNQTYIVTFSVKVVTSPPISKPTTLK
jgi:hypothetical protein